MILRPLVQGAFLSDEWAEILADRVATGRSVEDRKLLPAVLKVWQIDVTAIATASGKNFWEVFQKVWEKRNNVVHAGASVTREDTEEALDLIGTLIDKILYPIAEKLGLDLTEAGTWRMYNGREYKTLSPFKD